MSVVSLKPLSQFDLLMEAPSYFILITYLHPIVFFPWGRVEKTQLLFLFQKSNYVLIVSSNSQWQIKHSSIKILNSSTLISFCNRRTTFIWCLLSIFLNSYSYILMNIYRIVKILTQIIHSKGFEVGCLNSLCSLIIWLIDLRHDFITNWLTSWRTSKIYFFWHRLVPEFDMASYISKKYFHFYKSLILKEYWFHPNHLLQQ